MKKTVGLLLLYLKDKEPLAIIQKRGDFDYEKNIPEKFPGVFQLTVSGDQKNREDEITAVLREAQEELGSAEINKFLRKNIEKIVFLNRKENTDRQSTNFMIIVPEKIIGKISWHRSSGKEKMISQKDLKKIREFSNAVSIQKTKSIFMFPDQFSALCLAFSKLAIETPKG